METIDLNTINKMVINLKKRTDRLSLFEKECLDFFGNNNVEVIEACEPNKDLREKTKLAVWRSHQKCIELAKQRDYPFVLIMEDDVKFLPKAREVADRCFSQIPETWDVLLGGVYTADISSRISINEWYRLGDFSGLHFYIIHKKAYDKVLSMRIELKMPHIDRSMANKSFLNMECYVIQPMFCIQQDGYSDNRNMPFDGRSWNHGQLKIIG